MNMSNINNILSIQLLLLSIRLLNRCRQTCRPLVIIIIIIIIVITVIISIIYVILYILFLLFLTQRVFSDKYLVFAPEVDRRSSRDFEWSDL